MTNVNTATRAQLEIATIEDGNLELYLGGHKAILIMETEMLRKKIINYVIEGNETEC